MTNFSSGVSFYDRVFHADALSDTFTMLSTARCAKTRMLHWISKGDFFSPFLSLFLFFLSSKPSPSNGRQTTHQGYYKPEVLALLGIKLYRCLWASDESYETSSKKHKHSCEYTTVVIHFQRLISKASGSIESLEDLPQRTHVEGIWASKG